VAAGEHPPAQAARLRATIGLFLVAGSMLSLAVLAWINLVLLLVARAA
jgi:hypothetical protein